MRLQVRLLERIRMNAASVRPASLMPATPADIERMDNKCAVGPRLLPHRCCMVHRQQSRWQVTCSSIVAALLYLRIAQLPPWML